MLAQTLTRPRTAAPPTYSQPNSSDARRAIATFGDQMGQVVTQALSKWLRHQNEDGTWYSPRVVTVIPDVFQRPQFVYVVLDDNALFHFPRQLFIGVRTLDVLSSTLTAFYKTDFALPVFGFMPEECDDLRATLAARGVSLSVGVTYGIALEPIKLLRQAAVPPPPAASTASLPHRAVLDVLQLEPNKLQWAVGVASQGPVVFELPKTGHALWGGKTQAGKTTGVHAALYSLTQLNSPSAFRFAMISPKSNENAYWKDSPHRWSDIVATPADALDLLERVHAEIERRGQTLSQAGRICSTIAEWHAVCEPSERLPYLVLAIDETLDYLNIGGALGRAITNILQSIIRKGQAYGVFVWLLTQHVRDRKGRGIPTDIASQMHLRLVWRVEDQYAAEQFRCPGAEDILENQKGRLLIRHMNDRLQYVQGYWVGKDVLNEQARRFAQVGDDSVAARAITLSDQDRKLLAWALDPSEQGGKGYLSLIDLGRVAKVGPREAMRIAERFENEGWLEKDNHKGRKRKVTPKAIALMGGSFAE